jgi:glycine/serine hydroxymethyltransferase
MDEAAMDEVGDLIGEALEQAGNDSALADVKRRVKTLCERFPLYADLA